MPTRTPFATDFGEFSDELDLSAQGWTPEKGAASTSFGAPIELDDDGVSGKRARIQTSTTATEEDCYMTWDRLNGAAAVEVLALVKPTKQSSNDSGSRIIVRSSGLGALYCLSLGRNVGGSGGGQLAILKSTAAYNQSPLTVLNDTGWTVGTKQWLRFRAVDTLLLGKRWNYGDPEPATWDVEIEDAALASGRVGFGENRRTNRWNTNFYWFSAALNGGTAPGPSG